MTPLNHRMIAVLFLAGLCVSPAHAVEIVTIQGHHGTPAIVVDGKPVPPFLGMSYEPDKERIVPFVAAGVKILSFNTTADHTVYEVNRDVWLQDGRYDYSEVFEMLDMYLAQAPQTQFLLRVYTSAPDWWCKAHPEEMLTDDTGSIMIERPEFVHGKSTFFSTASLASEKWLQSAEKNVTRFVKTMEASPYGPKILAYHIAGAATEEWFNQLTLLDNLIGDYSLPMLKAWRLWLRNRYGSDIKLRKAWHMPDVSLDTIGLPSPQRRRESRTTFRDPIADVMLTDFYQFFQQVNVNVLRRLSVAAKKACDGRKLVGAFYGYLFSLGPSAPESGHLAVADVLNIPTLDFFASPNCYGDRRAAYGYADFMSATESVKLHGKLWFNENDIRTFVDLKTLLARYPSYDTPEGRDWAYRAIGVNDDPAVTIELLKLQLAATIGRGCGKWWFDITGGAYRDSRLIETIRHSLLVAETTFNKDRRSAAEIALVVDDRSMLALSFKHPLAGVTSSILPQLCHIGAPFDVVLLDDLPQADLERYKLLIFANTYWAGKPRIRTIANILRKDGLHALFLYAPGVFAPNRPWEQSPEAMRQLTGMDITIDPANLIDPVVELSPNGRKYLSIDDGHRTPPFGSNIMSVWCNDPDATPLGLLADGRIGLARKNNVFFCASPTPDSTLLGAVARQCGVHFYVPEGDSVYVTRSFIGIHTGPESGPHQLRFPGKTILHDLWNNISFGTSRTFTLPAGPGQTHLFRYEQGS